MSANSVFPLTSLAAQVVRQRTGQGTGGGGRGILRISDRIIATVTAPGNELYLVVIVILLIAVVVLTVLTVREFISWRRK